MARVLKGDFTQRRQSKDQKGSADEPIPGYQLKLAVAFSDPLIWRTVQVPGNMTLALLHEVIQICMGWDDSDTHQFLVGKIFYQSGFGIRDMKKESKYDERNFELRQLEEGMQFLFTYLYDGGEGWELEINLEQTFKNGLGHDSAILLNGERACPPPDVGDIHHYQQLLFSAEAGAGKDGVRLDLPAVPDFDPDIFDQKTIMDRLAVL